MLTQDEDEELLLFLEVLGHENCHRPTLLMGFGNNSSTTTMSSRRYSLRRTAADNFLYSENEKSDSEWLVTPPGSPSRSDINQLDAPDANPMALKSLLENISPKNLRTSLNNPSSVYGTRSRPTSSCSSRSTSRPSTPTRRSTAPAKNGARTPISRATSTAARATSNSSSTGGSSRSMSRPSSSSGTTSRVTLSTARETTGSATSTRSNNRPMTAPNPKPGSRLSTSIRHPSTPTGSLTILRSKPTRPASKPSLSQGASPIVRSRPWEPYEMPGFSLEAPSNLRTTLPDRPKTTSSSRIRAFGASSSSRSASIEHYVTRRPSCSPSRSRVPTGNTNSTVPPIRGRRTKKNNDDSGLISHVAKGNQKIEKVVNTRNLRI